MREYSFWKSLDWITLVLVTLLLVAGWLTVCSATYSFEDTSFFDFTTRAGKQLMWVICSMGIGFVLLMLDDDLYDIFAYIIYAALILLLVVTIFVATDTRGSHSWLEFGPVRLQPAEFAKFATGLALAKFMGGYGFDLRRPRSVLTIAGIMLLPMLLIILQNETGSALVFLSFTIMLYRQGMSGSVLFVGLAAVAYFVVGIKYGEVALPGTLSTVGTSVVLLLSLLFTAAMTWAYYRAKWRLWLGFMLASLIVVGLAWAVSAYAYAFNIEYVEWAVVAFHVCWLIALSLRERSLGYLLLALFALGSVGFIYSGNYLFKRVLQPHQQVRIEIILGMEEDVKGAGYNVNQSKIAIGSGGLLGKGFLNGTQTKLKYVPEQETDFIFCTIGEEQGFVGSTVVLLLYLLFILRLIALAERQVTKFGQVYGYCVVGVFLFHLFINIGMVLGLTPVIGVPLPFFSYGGSSLWGTTILLFVFLRIDAGRNRLMR